MINHTFNGVNSYTTTEETTISNKQVACKPYKAVAAKSGFEAWDVKSPLVELEVVFGDSEGSYPAGCKVYVRPFLDVPGWIKEVYTLNGQEISFIPKDFIVASTCQKPVWQSAYPWWSTVPPDYSVCSGAAPVPSVTSFTVTFRK